MTQQEAIEMGKLLQDNGIDPVTVAPARGTSADWWIIYRKPDQHFPYVFDTIERVQQAIAIRQHSATAPQH